ncbi:MAG: Gfo/Idh/MocA family oxidoreductase, partial [Actinomycetia bacterium]|nr:Gfo/Idh/MocA family oxidoreductase [Actinomycetes bacterium]
MKKIRCAIAGLGRIGSILEDDTKREKPASHAGAVINDPDCILLTGADPDAEKRDSFRKRWNCQDIFEDAEAMLEKIEPDIFHIAAPPSEHFNLLKLGLDKEIPVIICEKPLSEDIAEAEKMYKMSIGTKSKILINHERRYALNYKRVKDIIENKGFGKLLSVTGKLYMGQHRKIKNMLFDDGT